MTAGRAKRPDHPPVVYVEWHDSRTLTSGWEDRRKVLNEAPRDFGERLVSAGLLLQVSKKFMVLAVGLAPNDDVCHVLQIPRSEIVRFQIVKRQRGMKLVKAKRDRR